MAKKTLFEETTEEETMISEATEAAAFPVVRHSLSGLYVWTQLGPLPAHPDVPQPAPVSLEATEEGPEGTTAAAEPSMLPTLFQRQELRLDIDGTYPLFVASGTLFRGITTPVQWIAKLVKSPVIPNLFTGSIWYKDPAGAPFPYTKVSIKVNKGPLLALDTALVTYSGGVAPVTLLFRHKSAYFHPMNFECDFQAGITPETSYNTGSHPNRPASLPVENLTIATVYRRAGFEVTTTPGGAVPLSGAGADSKWSDAEMDDAMLHFWSHYANAPQWAAWAFFAGQHEMGSGLGGIMFDDSGPYQRQGTAIFYDSFISHAPAGDPNPTAYVERMKFWTAVHELGHTFNLAHSWQKALPVSWIPLVNDPAALSFMNYPYLYPGTSPSETAFWKNFQFRFTSDELLFMRHAPGRFVEQGFAAWFDHHGFQQANTSSDPAFRLEVRTNRSTPALEYLEPLTIEMKLTNVSTQPVLVSDDVLLGVENMTIVTKRDGQPARQFKPFAKYCRRSPRVVLKPSESKYESLFVSSGLLGWNISDPGNYTVQVALHMENEDIVSNPLRLRVAPPVNHEQEVLAQDFFSEEVGRILTFDGSQFLTQGNNVLNEVVEKLKNQKVAVHARVALGMAQARDYKRLKFKEAAVAFGPAAQAGAVIESKPASFKEARTEFVAAFKQPEVAAESLGHIDYKYYIDRFTDFLEKEGATQEALGLQDQLLQTLTSRKVLDSVLNEIRDRRDQFEGKPKRPIRAAS